MSVERIIPAELKSASRLLTEHLERYEIAASLLRPNDIVVDAACGVGYGSPILSKKCKHVYGYDISPEAIDYARNHYQLSQSRVHSIDFALLDLDKDSIAECDVLVSFETIEHLKHPDAFLERAKSKVRRLIMLSTPIVPTKHMNPFHLHDLNRDIIERLMKPWEPVYFLIQQGSSTYGVWIFKRERVTPEEAQQFLLLNLKDQQVQFLQLKELLEQQKAWSGELENSKAWLEKQMSDWKDVAKQQEQTAQQLHLWIRDQQTAIAQLQEAVAQREGTLQEWQERSRAQEVQITQFQTELWRLLESKSWQLTAPLRTMYGALLRIKSFLKIQTILIAKKILPKPVKRSIKKVIGWEVGEELTIPSSAATKVVEQTPWNKQRPLVSVIIPCYNYGRFVEEAIDSVLRQTLQNFEIIVVNDGSTDQSTNDLLKRLQKPKTCVIHQVNQGLPEARNQGIRHARGKYICCLDADDTLEPTYLEKTVSLLEANPGVAFAYSWVCLFGDGQGIWYTEPFDLQKLLRYNHISVASVFRYDAWKAVGGYRSEMRQGYEDWEFWIRLGAHGLRGQLIPEALFNHRCHGHTMTHSAQEKHQQIVSYIANCHRDLFAESKRVKKIQTEYFNARVNQPFLNLRNSDDFCQDRLQNSMLILVPWLPVGGAETVLYYTMSGLQGQKEFYLVTTVPSKNEWHDRFYGLTTQIYHLPNFLPEYAWEDFVVNLLYTRSIKQVLISASEFGYTLLPRLKAKIPSLHIIDLLHNDSDLGYFRHSMTNDPYIDIHITVSELISRRLHEVGHIDPSKIRTIYNAVDTETVFNPARYQLELVRQRWQLPAGKRIVTYIGRLSREKQPDHFLEIAAQLKECGDIFFVLVGNGHLRDVVEAEIAHLDLSDCLRWYKEVLPEQIPEILLLTDVLALTSEVEGFPMTVLEALAMGVPVVSYDVGDVRSIVQSGVNGFIVPPQQQKVFVRCISELLSDEQLLRSCKQRARTLLIEQGFTLERMVQQYGALLCLDLPRS